MSQQPFRFGVLTPIVSLNPRRQPTWEIDAGPEELRQIALTADRLGYHHLTCSEHVVIPTEVAKARGARYYDPLATFGFMAAVTKRIRFATHVLVLPYHHPLAVAKRYGSYNETTGHDRRTVFAIDRTGKIAYVDLAYSVRDSLSFGKLQEALKRLN